MSKVLELIVMVFVMWKRPAGCGLSMYHEEVVLVYKRKKTTTNTKKWRNEMTGLVVDWSACSIVQK